MPNRLIDETSPYLQQHAHNPVDWYPWGEEALKQAQESDRPILLSIGYSACHWCHVMERESFESTETAAIMNTNFINIKVDREEHPDLDAIYMRAVQAMTGHGGWPLTVFLTPDRKPFFGGTYFPPEDRSGLPGFPRILQAIAQAYHGRRSDVLRSAETVMNAIRQELQLPQDITTPLTPQIMDQAFQRIAPQIDSIHGGLGPAPKFPQPMVWEFLLSHAHRTGERQPRLLTELTLKQMAYGGIFDQLGGGFHRYSTDDTWLAPHFEKMLYDNALLSRLYLHAYQATGKSLFRQVAQQTLDYVLREMTGPDGEFYSAQDADSEGEEGKYYVWSYQELRSLLPEEERIPFFRYYGVTPQGNFDGHNILHLSTEVEVVARECGLTPLELEDVLRQARGRLLTARAQRIPPDRDDKVLTAWNGLMLHSFAEGAKILGRDDYLKAAERNAAFVLEHLRSKGRVLRVYRKKGAKLNGYLEDYAFLVDGLLALYEAGWQRRWLDEGRTLADGMIELFWDSNEQAFFDTGLDHEELLLRPRELFDNVIPSGGAMATTVLLKLAVLTGEERYHRIAEVVLRSMRQLVERHPTGFGQWLCAMDFYLSPPKEIVIVGPRADKSTQALVSAVYDRFLPNKVVAGYDPMDTEAALGLPLLEEREMVGGNPTAYVCQNYACQFPVTSPEALAKQLGERL